MSNSISDNDEQNDALMGALRRLPRSIEPRRDLWPGIADALSAPTRRQGFSWPYALAAGVGCMALGALLTFAVLRFESGQPARPIESPARLVEASFGGYTALGPEYERARASLAIGLAERLHRLPPDAQLKVERNLGEIRRALREINVALALDPDSVLLQQLLLSTYQDELALLANVNQMAGKIPARTET